MFYFFALFHKIQVVFLKTIYKQIALLKLRINLLKLTKNFTIYLNFIHFCNNEKAYQFSFFLIYPFHPNVL